MSIKTRFFATTVAASLLIGTASFAISEPRRARRVDVAESQSFVGEVFEWVRELLGGRGDSSERTKSPDSGITQKDGTCADPNGACHK